MVKLVHLIEKDGAVIGACIEDDDGEQTYTHLSAALYVADATQEEYDNAEVIDYRNLDMNIRNTSTYLVMTLGIA